MKILKQTYISTTKHVICQAGNRSYKYFLLYTKSFHFCSLFQLGNAPSYYTHFTDTISKESTINENFN